MTILRLGVWIIAAVATAGAWRASAEKPPRPEPLAGTVVLRDLAYRVVDGRPLALDLYLPAASGEAHPILVAVHGGSWVGGSKTDYGPQFARLAQRGIAVAVVDYRLARPGAPSWPDAPTDITAALDWLEAHAEEHQLDVRRAAVIGTSSGGLLAALAGSSDRRIRAILCISAPMDLAKLMEGRSLAHEPALVFLGDDPRGLASRARDASPIHRATPEQPPTLLIHGTDDRWTPIEQARNMLAKLEELNAPSRLIEIEGAKHGFQLKVGDPAPRDLLPEVVDFLETSWRSRRSRRVADPPKSAGPASGQR